MTTIATFTTAEDAHLCRMFLESRGIRARVLDEYLIQVCWHYNNALGGVRVSVDDDDLDAAIPIYQDYMSSLLNGPYPLNPVRAWPVVACLSILFGMPFILFGRYLKKSK